MRQSASERARIRKLRSQYRKRICLAVIAMLIIGIGLGIAADRMLLNKDKKDAARAQDTAATVQPEELAQDVQADPVQDPSQLTDGSGLPVGEDQGEDPFEDALTGEDWFVDGADASGEPVDAEPADGANADADKPKTAADATAVAEKPVKQDAPVDGEPTATEATAEQSTDATAEQPTEAIAEQPAEATVEQPTEATVEQPTEVPAEPTEAPTEAPTATPTPEPTPEPTATPEPEPEDLIIPFGESYTYTTQIKADGSARIAADDEPFETLTFTQTVKSHMLPADYADRYAKVYRLVGNEAGVGFELTLNDYAGSAVILPQRIIRISFESEDGSTSDLGYQLMDAEIAGKYDVALTNNEPKMLYKRYQFSENADPIRYLVVTTYNDGEPERVLFDLVPPEKPEEELVVTYPMLQKGTRGDDVKALQQALEAQGYLAKGSADGNFGGKTETAIKNAQADFGLKQTGIADNEFQHHLYANSAEETSVDAENATGDAETAAEPEGLKRHSKGDDVKKLQQTLKDRGYLAKDSIVDGVFGLGTEAAVKKAQKDFDMEQTGVADDAFLEKLYAERTDLKRGDKGEEVRTLQQALKTQGYLDASVTADGNYGPKTEEAVKKAQAAFEMEQTGATDSAFLEKLYGDDTAQAADEAAAQTGADSVG